MLLHKEMWSYPQKLRVCEVSKSRCGVRMSPRMWTCAPPTGPAPSLNHLQDRVGRLMKNVELVLWWGQDDCFQILPEVQRVSGFMLVYFQVSNMSLCLRGSWVVSVRICNGCDVCTLQRMHCTHAECVIWSSLMLDSALSREKIDSVLHLPVSPLEFLLPVFSFSPCSLITIDFSHASVD